MAKVGLLALAYQISKGFNHHRKFLDLYTTLIHFYYYCHLIHFILAIVGFVMHTFTVTAIKIKDWGHFVNFSLAKLAHYLSPF